MLLILFKLSKFNEMSELTDKYCKLYKEHIDHYFILCDENINNDIEISDNIIKFKTKENNWESLLIKVVKAFNLFKEKNYTNIMVSNVSTCLNLPVLLNKIDKNIQCLAYIGHNYNFNNVIYDWPSGAGYIFNMDVINEVCKFFNENKYITINNTLSDEFCKNHPTTDDIFFGYFFKLNNIRINYLDRFDIIHDNNEINSSLKNFSHIRIKTSNYNNDYRYLKGMCNIIYKI